MTAASGVPSALRPVLEKALMVSHMMARTAEYTPDLMRDAWESLHMAVRAAPASDAGMPEGERVEGWTGKPGPCPNCGAIRNERDAHFCSSTRSAPASGASPEERDGELEGLLHQLCAYEMDRGIANYRGDDETERELTSHAVDTMDAIHAHVEQQKRAARETARDGDFTVGDPHLNQLLYAFADQWLNVGRAPNGAVAGGYDYSDRMATLGAIQRLYRAATGEVVGTATLYGGGKDGTSIGPGPDDELPELDDRERYRVDLVLRRDKEGV